MTRKLSRVLVMTVVTLFMIGITVSVFAESQWAKEHPRRHQVNTRLNNQNNRISQKVAEGGMTKAQAGKLKRQDRQIRQEVRAMASQNGGHITKQEQKTLNQQENVVSREIGR